MINDNKHIIDEYFKDNLYDFEVPAPQGIFKKIEKEVAEKQRRRYISYFQAIAASVLVILALSIGYFWGKKNVEQSFAVASQTENTVIEKNEIVHLERNTKKAHKPTIQKEVQIDNTLYSTDNQKEVKTESIQLCSIQPKQIQLNILNEFDLAKKANAQALQIEAKSLVVNSIEKKTIDLAELKTNQLAHSVYKEDVNERILIAYSVSSKSLIEGENWKIVGDVFNSSNNYISKTNTLSNNYATSNTLAINNSKGLNWSNTESSSGNYATLIEAKNQNTTDNDQAYLSAGSVENITNTTTQKAVNYRQNATIIRTVIKPKERSSQYVEFPVIAKYSIVNKGVNISINSGMSASIPVIDGYSTNRENTIINNNSNAYCNGIIGFSVELPMSQHLNFRIDPLWRYPISANAQDTKPFHIQTGFAVRF
jgi:hypothetical protein